MTIQWYLISGRKLLFGMDKKNQLDVTFCILYFSSNICSTCFGQPCVHHQELTTAWCYSLVLVCAVTICVVTQICLTVSGLCVDMRVFFGVGFIVVCRYSSVCNQIKVHTRGCGNCCILLVFSLFTLCGYSFQALYISRSLPHGLAWLPTQGRTRQCIDIALRWTSTVLGAVRRPRLSRVIISVSI